LHREGNKSSLNGRQLEKAGVGALRCSKRRLEGERNVGEGGEKN